MNENFKFDIWIYLHIKEKDRSMNVEEETMEHKVIIEKVKNPKRTLLENFTETKRCYIANSF